jgi:probable addiction module antidote protein
MGIKTKPYDIANYLDSDEMIHEYFSLVLEDGDAKEIVRALCHIARARGMTDLASKTELGQEGISENLSTILEVMRAAGLRLTAQHAGCTG